MPEQAMSVSVNLAEPKIRSQSDYTAVSESDSTAPLTRSAVMRIRPIPRSSKAVTILTTLVVIVAACAWLSQHPRAMYSHSRIAKVIKAEEAHECGMYDHDIKYWSVEIYQHITNVGNVGDCCHSCNGDAKCGAWSYRSDQQMCTLMHEPSGPVKKIHVKGIVSGQKNAAPAPAPSGDTATHAPKKTDAYASKCVGSLQVAGYGSMSLISAGANTPNTNAGLVKVVDNTSIVTYMGGRVYFGETCEQGPYNNKEYSGLKLLGKRIRYTTDLSGTQCGCNAAFYLTPMQSNPNVGKCSDYYCDAMSVCGFACAEIDMQEANQFAWFSSLHAYHPKWGPDKLGISGGYGGSNGVPSHRDWTKADYGVGAKCIDTAKPFDISISFPVDDKGILAAMEVELTQKGKDCSLSARMDDYTLNWPGIDPWYGMPELTNAMKAGVTPIASYWSSKDMLWMDGPGDDGQGPCTTSDTDTCSKSVRFSDFSIEDIEIKKDTGNSTLPNATNSTQQNATV